MNRVMLGVLSPLVGAFIGGIAGAVVGSFWISVFYANDIIAPRVTQNSSFDFATTR
jgi:hypothetical protein